MNLYKIANDYESLLDNSFNPETGEVDEKSLVKLEELATDIKEKGIAIASYIKNIDAEKGAIENAKKEMAEREKKLESKMSYLKSYLQSNMERCAIKEISCPYFAIKLKKSPLSVDIIDEKEIPSEYFRSKEVITINKIKIKEEILAGVIIPGVTLKQNNYLEIK